MIALIVFGDIPRKRRHPTNGGPERIHLARVITIPRELVEACVAESKWGKENYTYSGKGKGGGKGDGGKGDGGKGDGGKGDGGQGGGKGGWGKGGWAGNDPSWQWSTANGWVWQ